MTRPASMEGNEARVGSVRGTGRTRQGYYIDYIEGCAAGVLFVYSDTVFMDAAAAHELLPLSDLSAFFYFIYIYIQFFFVILFLLFFPACVRKKNGHLMNNAIRLQYKTI